MQVVDFGDGHTARVVRPRRFADLTAAVGELGLNGGAASSRRGRRRFGA